MKSLKTTKLSCRGYSRRRILIPFASLLVFIFLIRLNAINVYGQVFSNKEVGKKNTALADSLKQSEYPYALPIWGEKATKLGFNLPLSAGLGLNYIWQKSDLVIDNLQVGFNNGPMYNLDEIVRFNKATSEVTGVNIRPDIWLFPFLNIYGVLAKGRPLTTVNWGVWIPDSTNTWKEVFSNTSKVSFESTSVGFGMTPTMGVGGGWMALDMNFTWTDIPALSKPAFAYVFGPRVGKSFKLRRPDQTITFWAGGFRFNIKSGTDGSLPIGDVLELDGLQEKIDQGIIKVGDAQQQVDTWWNNLTPPQQSNPVNKAKYETANRALESAGNVLNSANEAVQNAGDATVQYSLDKRPKDMWNFVVGSQFQLNKHFMLRGEYGFLGSRQQFIGMLQYRFGL
jgi:hypothetical protein